MKMENQQKEARHRNKFVIGAWRFISRYGIFIFAIGVVLLNGSLAFDNVVWGDEAFSGNIIRGTDFHGIFQRIYYWENHPPLYYYMLRIMADLCGYHTYVYHFSALIPFAGGIVLAVTLIRKRIGTIPVAFFVLLGGLSATCVEYNLEIRMYALCFFMVLCCVYFSYAIFVNNASDPKDEKKRYWVGIILCGVAAAYTHYYGLVISGILLFATSLFYYLKNKGKTWKPGVFSILAYLILYAPWIGVMIRQMSYVQNSWWMTEPEAFREVIRFAFGGQTMSKILFPVTIGLSILVLLLETGVVRIQWHSPREYLISFHSPKWNIAQYDADLCMFLVCWLTVILVMGFSYGICYVYKPILAARYMYPLIPILFVIFMLCVKKMLGWNWGNTEKEIVNLRQILVGILFAVLLVIGLFDFKQYRSVVKTQEFQTQRILTMIGEPSSETVFTANGVKHLSWTVLQYYYPESEVFAVSPSELTDDNQEIWAFMGYELGADEIAQMEERGYSVEESPDMWMGKYGCNLYHFRK